MHELGASAKLVAVFVFVRALFDVFYGEWTLFIASTLLGARWIYQGATRRVPRDLMGDYKYAEPIWFVVVGVILQIPLVLRLWLFHSSGH